MEAAGKGNLLPGVEGALTFLRRKGVRVGIVTRNCEEAVRKVFPEIDHYCDVFFSRDSVKKVKPHPDHLTAVLEAFSVRGSDAVMVGDHLIDIQAGKKVKMKTIGVLTGRIIREEFEKAGADYVLRMLLRSKVIRDIIPIGSPQSPEVAEKIFSRFCALSERKNNFISASFASLQ
jgi:phosphoglycolate phosphatase